MDYKKLMPAPLWGRVEIDNAKTYWEASAAWRGCLERFRKINDGVFVWSMAMFGVSQVGNLLVQIGKAWPPVVIAGMVLICACAPMTAMIVWHIVRGRKQWKLGLEAEVKTKEWAGE
jgi:hypothetical protein